MMKIKKKKVVCIGGGTGLMAPLRGLVRLFYKVWAVIGMADHGGGSGRMRDDHGILPPGDIIKTVVALSPNDPSELRSRIRMSGGESQSVGNLLFLGVLQACGGDYLKAIRVLELHYDCRGKILPATLDDATLTAETNRRYIRGEGEIEKWIYGQLPSREDEKLIRVFLRISGDHSRFPMLLDQAARAIREADLVVIGPGSFYTSLIAVLKVRGMREALAGKKIAYVVNMTTNPRETPKWFASTFVDRIEKQIRRRVDFVICNDPEAIPESSRRLYRKEHAHRVPVDIGTRSWNGRKVMVADLIPQSGELVRHDPDKLGRLIADIAEGGKTDYKQGRD